MDKESFKCRYCGSENFKFKQAGKYTELICEECGKFIRYLRKGDDLKNAFEILRKQGKDNRASKVIRRYGHNLTIKCSKCNCILFNAAAPYSEKQFNALNSNFCPNCGTEFVDDQKIFTWNYTKNIDKGKRK